MGSFTLPPDLELRDLRKYARQMLKAAAAGEPEILAKFTELSKQPSLTAAQLLVAREWGFSSWAKLKLQVERNEADPGNAAIRRARKRRGQLADGELPAVVPVGTVVARTPKCTFAIRAIRVHSGFCQITLDWVVRRTTESTELWKRLHRTVFVDLVDPWPGWEELPEGSRPVISLAYADGREVSSDNAGDWISRAHARPDVEVPVLSVNSGSGSGEEGDARHTTCLYLSPLPPEGELTFTLDWPVFGISQARSVVDAGQIQAAARRVRQL